MNVLRPRRMHIGQNLAVRAEEKRARNVRTVGRMRVADLGYVIRVEADHDEVFGFRDNTWIGKNMAVITTMGAPIREEYETNRLVVALGL